jgi:hypothetical protein
VLSSAWAHRPFAPSVAPRLCLHFNNLSVDVKLQKLEQALKVSQGSPPHTPLPGLPLLTEDLPEGVHTHTHIHTKLTTYTQKNFTARQPQSLPTHPKNNQPKIPLVLKFPNGY